MNSKNECNETLEKAIKRNREAYKDVCVDIATRYFNLTFESEGLVGGSRWNVTGHKGERSDKEMAMFVAYSLLMDVFDETDSLERDAQISAFAFNLMEIMRVKCGLGILHDLFKDLEAISKKDKESE